MRRAHLVQTVLLVGLLVLGACARESGTSDWVPPPIPNPDWATVTGVVVDAGGRPVVDALVQPISLDNPPKPVPELAVTSGPDGRYEWRLPAGRYEFSAVKDGLTSVPAEVTVAANQTEQLELRLP